VPGDAPEQHRASDAATPAQTTAPGQRRNPGGA
jgi:hypothetical protein